MDWQKHCLSVAGDSHLVYSAPTSAGKTLVAEIIALRRMIEKKQRVLFLVPFVSMVIEKTNDLKNKLEPLGLVVEGYHSYVTAFIQSHVDVCICTFEKASAIVDRALANQDLNEIGCLIVDEVHMILDRKRGRVVESVIAKFLYASPQTQIVGMSATFKQIDAFADWLRGERFSTEFRPVPVHHFVVSNGQVFEIPEFSVSVRTISSQTCEENFVQLVREVIEIENKSVLVFAATKRWTQNCCQKLLGIQSKFNPDMIKQREDIVDSLKQLPWGVDEDLCKYILSGIAYHHAGLAPEERTILENAFRAGIISVLVATSTLAAGVNLPARRVIFRSPYVGSSFLDSTRYSQMSGRAGRFGLDQIGESFLLCSKQDFESVKKIFSDSPSDESNLHVAQVSHDHRSTLMELLAVSSLQLSKSDLANFLVSMFTFQSWDRQSIEHHVDTFCRDMMELKVLELFEDDKIQLTTFGSSIAVSGFDVEQGLKIFSVCFLAYTFNWRRD
jgi:DNA polymerase theta